MFITEPIPGTRGDRLAFGFEWRAYATKGANDERRRYARELFASHYAEYAVGPETVCGFITPETRVGLRQQIYSAAARIAVMDAVKSRSAVLVLIEHQGQVLLVFVVRGAVRLDEVLTPEQCAAKRLEVETLCEKNEWELTVFGRGEIVGAVDEQFNLADLMVDRKVGKLKKVPAQIPPIVSVAVLGIAFVYGAHEVVQWTSPPPPPPKQPPTYEQQYSAALTRALGTDTLVASSIVPDLLGQVGAMDTNRAGWQVSRADCDSTGACRVTWKREGGTFDDFDSAADPAYRPIFFGPDGMSLSSNGPIAHPKARVTIDRKQEWPTWEHLKRTLLQPAQQLSTKPDRLDSFGYKVTLHNPTDLLGRPPPLSAAKVRFARMGKWEIEGFKWQMKLIRQLPPNMVLDSLVIELRTDGGDQRAGQLQQGQLQQGLHFHAEGKFYVY